MTNKKVLINIYKKIKEKEINNIFATIIILIFFISCIFYITYIYTKNYKSEIEQKITDTNLSIENINKNIDDIKKEIQITRDENINLSNALKESQSKSDSIKKDIKKISNTVGDLEKLTEIDPELLKKYSKIYFLNEHYAPSDLKTISSEYTFDKNRVYQIDKQVWPFLRDLMNQAYEENVNLKVISAFRSFSDQAILKNGYKVTYGAGTANQFSADQGYSEHQLGTTIDFTTDILGAGFENFDQSQEYQWLSQNAHKFGFVLSYPKNNNYYIYEPWHWRFVGIDLATDLYDDGKYFYDLDQREIDKYLIDLFD